MTFVEFFQSATESQPYPYQERFATAAKLPHLLRAPTGRSRRVHRHDPSQNTHRAAHAICQRPSFGLAQANIPQVEPQVATLYLTARIVDARFNSATTLESWRRRFLVASDTVDGQTSIRPRHVCRGVRTTSSKTTPKSLTCRGTSLR